MAIFALPEDLENTQEPQPAEAGEYKLQVLQATCKKSKDGKKDMIVLMLEFLNKEDVAPIFHNLILTPNDKADHLRLLDLKTFFQAFDVPMNRELDSDSLIGKSGWAFIELEAPNEKNNNRATNRIKRWVQSGG